MKIYRAKDGDRLDKIVYKHYGNLRVFERVLELNANLKEHLKSGDIVKLPEIEKEPIIKENALW